MRFSPTLAFAMPLFAIFVAPAARAVTLEVSEVSPGIYRGTRPGGVTELRKLRDEGFKTVINLQGDATIPFLIPGESPEARDAEGGAVEALGMEYFNLPVNTVNHPNEMVKANVRKILTLLQDRSLQPIYVHCNEGADRTGFVVAAFRIAVQGCSAERAVQEMHDAGKIWTPLFTMNQEPYLQSLASRPGSGAGCPLASMAREE